MYQSFEIEKHCSIICFSPCDVLSGEGTDEPLHIQNLEWGKHQVSWFVHVYSALRIDNPVSGLKTHILLITFCWALIYPGLTKHDWVKKHVKDHHVKTKWHRQPNLNAFKWFFFFSLWREALLGKERQQTAKLTKFMAKSDTEQIHSFDHVLEIKTWGVSQKQSNKLGYISFFT